LTPTEADSRLTSAIASSDRTGRTLTNGTEQPGGQPGGWFERRSPW
jgi:hypothetical protein